MTTNIFAGLPWQRPNRDGEDHYVIPAYLDGPPISEFRRGVRHFTDPEVRAVRAAFVRGWTHKQIGDALMLSDRTISSVVNRRSYRKVFDGPIAHMEEIAGAPPPKRPYVLTVRKSQPTKRRMSIDDARCIRAAYVLSLIHI